MKLLGRLMMVVGILGVMAAGTFLLRDLSRARGHDAARDGFDRERDTVLAQLHEARLEYRGYQSSLRGIPDSVRVDQSAVMAERYESLRKQIRKLNMQQEDLKRRMGWEERKKGEVLADTKSVTGTLGGGGLLLIVAGLFVARGARRVSG